MPFELPVIKAKMFSVLLSELHKTAAVLFQTAATHGVPLLNYDLTEQVSAEHYNENEQWTTIHGM